MSLIKSISGIRGTIGGKTGENLTPTDIVKFAAAFGTWVQTDSQKQHCVIVVGRDARISGSIVQQLIVNTLLSLGIDVIDIDLATTPTVEMEVVHSEADGGIIITASHNPRQWNALKLLNRKGEFLNDLEGKDVLRIADNELFTFCEVDSLGKCFRNENSLQNHIDKVKSSKLVDCEAIVKANFKVVIDCVNSVGGIAIPELLKQLGVSNVVMLHCVPDGNFAHNPEPLPEHLHEISAKMKSEKADVGFVVDPDVDRLAIVNEDGSMFGEEYTLVAVADYILQNHVGNTVSNLSSSRALRDVTQTFGGQYFAATVGEVNVVSKMKEVNAIIGGEGSGGVIFPALHYGRDALVGTAIILQHLLEFGGKLSELKAELPEYHIAKAKIDVGTKNPDSLIKSLESKYSNQNINTDDGLRIDFDDHWVHFRKSNTEPIIRCIVEAKMELKAQEYIKKYFAELA